MKNFVSILLVITSLAFYACEEEEDPCARNPQLCFEEQYEKDNALIDQYIADNNLSTTKHESGLHYSVNNPGVSETAEAGQFVTVDYVGKLLDGTVFDTSIDSVAMEAGIFDTIRNYKPISFQLGTGRVIKGWDLGLTFFEEGGKGFIIIPSYMAYGPKSVNIIPANSVLYFEINLLDVKY